MKPTRKPIRVLVVDDSALVRNILSKGLSMDKEIEVVGTAKDPYIARDMIIKHRPDVLTLDVEMPRMDGVEFLRKLMPQYPIPVVMVSSLTQKGKRITLEALEAGAVEIVPKPTTNLARGLNEMMNDLIHKVKVASKANVSHWKNKRPSKTRIRCDTKALSESTDKVVAIGASTGGTEAIKQVVSTFPAAFPGVVIVQHMPAGFTRMFAERLNSLCAMEVKEASNGDKVIPGRILVAAGDYHMKVRRSGGYYYVDLVNGEKVSGHRPSVNVLMHSVAKFVGPNAIGIMLTGMGSDGAEGMLAMREAGAKTVAQDEETSVFYGMPKVAYEIGAVEKVLPLDEIGPYIIQTLSRNGK
ncbi:MAG TPA: chemotaxis response regulator protein-glutamate methylesterase [Deltaproteobacteria bacterium]|nr:chemotaxis response regulator protein-glutamate methylesterase [Deltaproteobacteria bacterium]